MRFRVALQFSVEAVIFYCRGTLHVNIITNISLFYNHENLCSKSKAVVEFASEGSKKIREIPTHVEI